MKDSDLKQLVLEEIATEKGVILSNIAIKVNDQVVTLLGTQPSLIALSAIEKAVKRVGGVKAIAMEMDIATDPDQPDDSQLAGVISDLITINPSIPEKQIQIVVEEGVVTLSGSVESHYERVLARKYIESLKGVRKVIDNISISKNVTDFAIRNTFVAAMERRAAINEKNIQVTVAKGVVYLNGAVRNLIEKESVIETAWSVPGVQFVIDKLSINHTIGTT